MNNMYMIDMMNNSHGKSVFILGLLGSSSRQPSCLTFQWNQSSSISEIELWLLLIYITDTHGGVLNNEPQRKDNNKRMALPVTTSA